MIDICFIIFIQRRKRMMKKIAYALFGCLFVATLLVADFYLPSKDAYHFAGTEVKRVDKDGVINARNPQDGPTIDVYFIQARQGEDIHVFRNEDTGFGLPLYFKYNSADIQGKANAYLNDKAEVQITSYGWRVKMLSTFPNVISMTPMSENPSSFSLMRWIFMGLIIILFGYLGFRLHKLLSR